MNISFSSETIGIMALVASVCTLLPLIYLGYFRAKTGAKLSSFFIGIGFSVLFSFFGEYLINIILLIGLGLGKFVNVSTHPVYAAVYYSITAGLMAELGSFVALKYCMKSRPGKENAFAFGLGKGGFECIIYGGIVYITNIVLALFVNSFGADGYLKRLGVPETELVSQRNSIAELAAIPTEAHLLDGSQRILALCLQTALAILVYMAVTYKPYFKFFPIAIALHILGYLPLYLKEVKLVTNTALIMTLTLVYTFAVLVFAYRLYHANAENSPNKKAAI